MGQSAGSFSTTYHLVSPKSKGLFRRIIAQSGVGGVMARVLPRKKKTTVADPHDAWTILKDRQLYRYLD